MSYETKMMTPEEHTGVYKEMAETIVSEDLDLDARVQRGALHLDEHFPGWANKINLKIFRISSAENCVIGQLHGDYFEETINKVAKIYPENQIPSLGEDDPKLDKFATKHGFMTHEDDGDWDMLQESWVKAIAARQAR